MNCKRTGKRILAFTVAALFAGVVAAAQQQPGATPPGQQPGQASPPPNMPNSPEAGAGVPGSEDSMSRSFGDQMFVRDTLAGSTAEAQMSLLAEQRSPSSDVKQYGQNMVLIHNQLEDQLKPIAQQLGVKENPKLNKKQKQQVDALKTLSGPAFDQAYIQDMAKAQKHDVKQFKTEANAAQTPAIQQAAKMDEPVFSQHLQVLEQIAQNHNVTIATK